MNAQEFKDRFLPLSAAMYRTAYSLLGNPQDAEDAMQEAFIRLWQRREKVPASVDGGTGADERTAAYCLTLTRNLCFDLLRRGRLAEADVTAEEVTVADTRLASTHIEDEEAVARVHEAISRLPEGQQRVVEMHLVQERPLREIEQATGLSAVNVRVLLSRGRKKLQQILRR